MENTIRLSVFIGVLTTLMLLEMFWPRRKNQNRKQRWPGNLLLVIFNTLLITLILPSAIMLSASSAQNHQWGLFHFIKLPQPIETILSIVMLDLAIYWQHRLFHRIPLFWRLHRTHHTDIAYDVTTGVRFHPLEIVLSVTIKIALIVMLGANIFAVLIFEVSLNAFAIFNHANIKLSLQWDAFIRKFIVTPDMHRVHHSTHPHEHHKNFGFTLSCWDYLFSSYRAQPQDNHQHMKIGLCYFRDQTELKLRSLLTQPFRTPNNDRA